MGFPEGVVAYGLASPTTPHRHTKTDLTHAKHPV